MHQFRNKLLASTVIAAGFSLMVPAMASAQDQSQQQQQQQTPPPTTTQKANEVSEVVVTGSRIHRNEYNSAAPIQVLSGDTASLEGLANTAEILSTSSLVAGSFQVNNQLTGFVVTGGPGASTIQLRGLGANRTLVLVDGYRMGPAGVGGTVGPFDLNVIPASIVDRIEILKDGASSIYGSDAVAGVINVITKKNLDGGVIQAYSDISQYGGGNQYDVNGAFGKVFDRGYWNLSFDYYDQEALRAGQRPDTACAADYDFDANGHRLDRKDDTGHTQCFNLFANAFETTNNVFGLSSNGTVAFSCCDSHGNPIPHGESPGTLILQYPNPGQNIPGIFDGNSTNNFQPVPAGFVREDRAGYPDTFPYDNFASQAYNNSTVVSPSKLFTVTGRAGFDLSADTTLYGGFLVNRRTSEQDGDRQFFPTVYAGMDNTPASLRVFGAHGCQPTQVDPITGVVTHDDIPGTSNCPFFGPVGPSLLPIIPLKSDTSQRVDYFNVDGGIKGQTPSMGSLGQWDWDIHARASRSSGTYNYDFIYNDRVLAISGGWPTSTTTSSVCDQRLITISGGQKGGQCSTLGPNGFPLLAQAELSGKFTPAEAAFLLGNEQGKTTYDEQEIEASITGDLFTLPAGKVGAAFGVDARHMSLDDTPGINDQLGNLWGQTSAGITKGSDTVKEAFGEIEAPLVKGGPFMKSLDLQASARYTHYDVGGSNATYKVGLNWQVNDWLRFRGTKGTSFRAPALYELFLANQSGFLPQGSVDPCINTQNNQNKNIVANCTSQGIPSNYPGAGSSATIFTGGGAGHLKAETSDATTIGFILTPTFADLSIAVDYTDITVNNEVTTFGAGNIVSSCYASNDFPNNPFCKLFQRDLTTTLPNGSPNPNLFHIDFVNNSYVNVATQTERAIDVTARYRRDFDFGRLEINTQLTWDLQNTTQLFAGVPQPSYSGTTFAFKGPAFTGLTNVRFDHGPWTVLWSIQMIGGGSDRDLIGTNNPLSTRYSTTCVNTITLAEGNCSQVAIAGEVNATVPLTVFEKNYTEMTVYHTISLRRTWDTLVIQGGVQNLFNERPPAVSSSEFRDGTAALNGYDMVGRRFFLTIQKKF